MKHHIYRIDAATWGVWQVQVNPFRMTWVWSGPTWSSCCEALRIKSMGWPWSDIKPSGNGQGAKVEGYP